VVPPDPRRACLELAAGCVYDGSQYPNAFEWIELSPATKNVRVLFRAWLHNDWTIDRNQPNCPDGQADFELGAEPSSKPVPSRSAKRVRRRLAAPEIPLKYLKWLEARCAGVELLGQDVQQSLAIQLSHVYVPALTQREAAAAALEEPTPGSRMDPEEQRLVPLLHRIDEGSLYVPAAAGAGKSTFCRWAVLQSIPNATTSHPVAAPEEYQEPMPESLRTRLPLLVPLRDFGKDMDCGRGRPWHRSDLEQALATWVDQSAPQGLDGAMLKAHLAAGSAFLLLDGLDEVPVSESRSTVYPRQLLLSGLADALPAWKAGGPGAPRPAARTARAAAGAAPGAVRHPLVPHPEAREAGRRPARGDARP
jgi:hypothetical protein